MCLSLFLSVCLSVYLSVYLSVCLSVGRMVTLSICRAGSCFCFFARHASFFRFPRPLFFYLPGFLSFLSVSFFSLSRLFSHHSARFAFLSPAGLRCHFHHKPSEDDDEDEEENAEGKFRGNKGKVVLGEGELL